MTALLESINQTIIIVLANFSSIAATHQTYKTQTKF